MAAQPSPRGRLQRHHPIPAHPPLRTAARMTVASVEHGRKEPVRHLRWTSYSRAADRTPSHPHAWRGAWTQGACKILATDMSWSTWSMDARSL